LLTENQIQRDWRALFRENEVNEDTLARAEALLEGLRPESPLRHRLDGELNDLRKLKSKKPAPKKQAARSKSPSASP
jgi:hypothetical protein